MPSLTYIRLIGFTAGTLLMLFWMVVILGYRRQRNFERVFFFLCLALFFFYGGSLLALNAQIYYAQQPPLLITFAWTILTAGLCFAPILLLHLHLEYADIRGLIIRSKGDAPRWKRMILTFGYAIAIFFVLLAYSRIAAGNDLDFLAPASSYGPLYGIYLTSLLGGCAGWEWKFAKKSGFLEERRFHYFASTVLLLSASLAMLLHGTNLRPALGVLAGFSSILSLLPIFPFAALIYGVEKYNFLQIGRQKNLMYAISATFLALLYLSLVRRVGTVLEPVFPPEGTAAILLFLLVIFVEPIQRLLGQRLHRTAQLELDSARPLIAEIREKAREGNLRSLAPFIGERVKERFGLEDAWLKITKPSIVVSLGEQPLSPGAQILPIFQANWLEAALFVRPHGAMISGETRAALEFLCEQIPGALDLCQVIDQKLQLERELAERERLALVGQTAASISHNLKNPLGSIKTILQVQLENPEMPESMRGETKMVLEEISRLSAKLNQLLQFSRPAIRSGSGAASCDARLVIEEAAAVLRPQAEQRGITLRVDTAATPLRVAAAPEGLNDIASNLLVNALEAVATGGQIGVSSEIRDGALVLSFEDDGPGISDALKEKILQPFFTTKSQGTGLGLAIVARRVAECDGKLAWQSPARDGRGTRFEITLPLVEEGKEPS